MRHHVKCIHDKIKDFKCVICSYSTSKNSNLKAHEAAVPEKKKDYKCDKCEYATFCSNVLKRHMRRKHEQLEQSIKCDKCDYKTTAKNNLKRHMRVHDKPAMAKKMSTGEYAIYLFLTKYNITFEREKIMPNLLSTKNKNLRYDYAIPYNNIYVLVEFDGKQHFQEVKWSSSTTAQQLKDKYNYIVECDQKKNEYAIQHNYPLKRIKYTDFNDIEGLLMEFLQPYFNLTRT